MLAFFHTIAARIRGFLGQRDLESDFDQEMAAHLQMAEEDGLRQGLTIEEARRAARVQLGRGRSYASRGARRGACRGSTASRSTPSSGCACCVDPGASRSPGGWR